MELMKKQEEELKQKFYSSMVKPEPAEPELIMPLTLPRSFEGSSTLPLKENEIKKEKEKKKKNKKDKKKKEKRMKEKKKKSKEKRSKKSSSSESGSSSESSTETSDSEEEKKIKKEFLADLEGKSKNIKNSVRGKEKLDEDKSSSIPIKLPEKSKWELDDVMEKKPPLPVPPPPEPKEVFEVQEQPRRSELDNKVTKDKSKSEVSESEKESVKSSREKTKTREKHRDWSKNEDERSSRYDKKRSYRDKRHESSRRERRRESSWDRKKDYRSSRYRRSRTRSRSRSASREKVTPGVIPAPLYDLFKLPDKHLAPHSETSKSERSEDYPHETDDGESKFEKQAVEAAKKKKIQPVVNLPKSKFGFIGRMPFAKRRSDSGKRDDDSPKKEDSAELEAPPPPRITQPRPPSPNPLAPKPVLTTKTKVETAKEIVSKYQKAFQEKVEEPPQPAIQMPMMMNVEIPNPPLPPSPPVLTMIPPSPPKIRESPKSPKKVKKSPYPLPKDFQDALSIIYPEEKLEDKTDAYHNPEMLAAAMSYQASMGYGTQMMMSYPGMHMMAAMPQMAPPPHMMNASTMRIFNQSAPAPPPPTSDPSRETPSPVIPPPPPPDDLFESSFGLGSSNGAGIPGLDDEKMETSSKVSVDDMALLGIDAEDLAAQQL